MKDSMISDKTLTLNELNLFKFKMPLINKVDRFNSYMYQLDLASAKCIYHMK